MPGLATTRMSSKGQVVIPEEIRKRLRLKAGCQFVGGEGYGDPQGNFTTVSGGI